MSFATDFLAQLSVLCKRELLMIEQKSVAKQSGHPHREKRTCKSVSNGDREDRCLQDDTDIKYEDHNPHCGVQKCPENDLKICVESPPRLTESKEKAEKNDAEESLKKNYCVPCGLSLSRKITYEDHLLTDRHLGLICCEKCTQKLPYNDMEGHMKSVHSSSSAVFSTLKRLENGQFHCMKCDITFPMFHGYRKHCATLSHKGKMCKRCHFRSQSAEEMEKHFQEVHGNQKMQSCKVCGTAFASPIWLQRHMETAHSHVKEFNCSTCGKTFTRQDNLRRHEAEHHKGVRPFSCEICDLTFKYKRNVAQHMAVHNKKRHQCAICFKSFEDEIDLENHAKTHAGALFNCMVCGMSFPTYRKRERHLVKHMTKTIKVRRKKTEETTDLKSDESFCKCDTSPHSASVEDSTSAGHNLSEKANKNAFCEKEASKTGMTAGASPHKTKDEIRSSVETDCNTYSSKVTRPSREKIKKTEPCNKNGPRNSLSRKKMPELDIKLDNVSCDKLRKKIVGKLETPFSHVKNVGTSSRTKDLPSERAKPVTPKRAYSGKRNYATAFEKESGQVTLPSQTGKRVKKNHSSKENSPVSDVRGAKADKNSVSELNSKSEIFKECVTNVSISLDSPVKRKGNLPKISENESNVWRSTDEERIVGQSGKNCKSKRKPENNCPNASRTRPASSKKLAKQVPKPVSVDGSEKKCDNNVADVPESACLSKVVENEEDCQGIVECQCVEIQDGSWSAEDGIIVDLNNAGDMIVFDKPCYLREAVMNSKANQVGAGVDSVSEQTVFIDGCVTVANDILTIPVDCFVAKVNHLNNGYILPDTDSGVSLLNAEDFTQDNIFTLTVSDECIKAPVGYTSKIAETVGKVSQKKPSRKRETKSRRKAKYNCVDERKVLVRNFVSDSDDFYLPEFVIEEDSNQP